MLCSDERREHSFPSINRLLSELYGEILSCQRMNVSHVAFVSGSPNEFDPSGCGAIF